MVQLCGKECHLIYLKCHPSCIHMNTGSAILCMANIKEMSCTRHSMATGSLATYIICTEHKNWTWISNPYCITMNKKCNKPWPIPQISSDFPTRGEAIMLVKLSIILYSNSHNFAYYTHRFYLLFSKLCLV